MGVVLVMVVVVDGEGDYDDSLGKAIVW